MAPHLSLVALFFNPDTAPYARHFLQSLRLVQKRPWCPFGTIRKSTRLGNSCRPIEQRPDHSARSFTSGHRELIVALAARHRLPAIDPFRFFVAHGGQLSYGVDTQDPFRRSASFIHRIPKGDKPSDLPVQAPTKFELVINLKTAKALGLEVCDCCLPKPAR
jgi:putative ABC transport system substrate-binding protein